MLSADGRWVLSYNGEIYNFGALRRRLVSEGLPLRGGSDTEVLLGAVQCWGLARALEASEGMFALALWDRQLRQLHLVRDRFGEKPLFYGWIGDRLAFASELKALRRLPEFHPELDRDAVALYLRHNCIPAPHTAYRGVVKLRPGAMVTFSADASPGELPPPAAYWSARSAVEDARRRPRCRRTRRPGRRVGERARQCRLGPHDGRRAGGRIPVRRRRLQPGGGVDAAAQRTSGPHLHRRVRRPRLRRVRRSRGGRRAPRDRSHLAPGQRRRRRRGHPPTAGHLGRALRGHLPDPHAAGEPAGPVGR